MDKRLLVIFLIVFVNLFGFGIILPLLPYYVESLGAGPITIGLLTATFSLFQFISAPILGELSDKIGRRPVLLFSIIGTAVSFFLLGIAKTLPMLFLARIIDGASGGNISTAQAYIADITDQKNRTQSMGILMAAFGLGFSLGPALGGYLSQWSYSLPAFVAAIVAFVATILTWLFLPESITKVIKPITQKRKLFNWADFKDALTHPEIGLLIILTFLVTFAFSLMQGTFALFTEHALGFTAQTSGYVFAYIGILGILTQIAFIKPLLKFISEYKVASTSIALMAFSLALLGFSFSHATLYISVTLLALSNSVLMPVLTGLISKLTPKSEQGNIMGVSQSVNSLSRLFGPLTGTAVYSIFGMRAPYVLATTVLALTSFYSFIRLKPPRSTS